MSSLDPSDGRQILVVLHFKQHEWAAVSFFSTLCRSKTNEYKDQFYNWKNYKCRSSNWTLFLAACVWSVLMWQKTSKILTQSTRIHFEIPYSTLFSRHFNFAIFAIRKKSRKFSAAKIKWRENLHARKLRD